jgi:hypothetical protein
MELALVASPPSALCVLDGDCTDPLKPRCRLSDHQCVPCISSNDNCEAGQYCAENSECAFGCKSNEDCTAQGAGPLCNLSTRRCVECMTQPDCPDGKLCSSAGQCVDGCDPQQGKGCGSGFACCGNQCLNLTSDPFNCGACGNACTGTAAQCCNGVCVDPATDANNCGGCGKVCPLVNASAKSCMVGKCSYTCNSGFSDCAKTGSIFDACECVADPVAPACCGTGCQIQHDTGIPLGSGARKDWFDCTARDTWDEAQAYKACQAFAGSGTYTCNKYACTGKDTRGDAICADSPEGSLLPCACFGYTNEIRGHAFLDTECNKCPANYDPFWH